MKTNLRVLTRPLEKLLKGFRILFNVYLTFRLMSVKYDYRQRTTLTSSLPFVSASPPGFVTLEEIMKAANSVSNMTLAHEIAVDVDFHLQKVEPPSNRLVDD